MMFNWTGSGFLYGERLNFFSITSFDVEQIFYIYTSTMDDDDNIFYIKNARKINKNVISIDEYIDEKVKYIHLIETDDEFRKNFKRSYNLIKLECEHDTIITIGSYTDSKAKPIPDNSYILCQSDFVNVLAESKYIESADDIVNTSFYGLSSILSKNELTKQLLK